MSKKIFTLNSIACLLVCTYLNGIEFKLENKSNTPIFIRFFEKNNDISIPPFENFSLTKLDSNTQTNLPFNKKATIRLCISFTDPANKIELKNVKFYQFPIIKKNIYMYVDNTGVFRSASPLLKQRLASDKNNWDLQINDRGKWKLVLREEPKENIQKPEVTQFKKPIIQTPVFFTEESPVPETIKVTE